MTYTFKRELGPIFERDIDFVPQLSQEIELNGFLSAFIVRSVDEVGSELNKLGPHPVVGIDKKSSSRG